MNPNFKPYHMNATHADLAGNEGIGRYIFLPGSDGRARKLAEQFENLVIKEHPRGHHLYLGTLSDGEDKIDVAAISSGMGCPSMEIILHELFSLGGKRFLRVGSAGSLQRHIIQLGHLINAQASVRDEQTTRDYVPLSIPAVASVEYVQSINIAAENLGLADKTHVGTVHCKSSFYAREFGAGPQAQKNKEYMELLAEYGTLATEMETAALFIQSQLYDFQLKQKAQGPAYRVYCGALLGILSVPPHEFVTSEQEAILTQELINLAFEATRVLAKNEKKIVVA